MKKTILAIGALLAIHGVQAQTLEVDEKYHPSDALVNKVTGLLRLDQASQVDFFRSKTGLVGIHVVTKSFKSHTFYTNEKGQFISSGVMVDTETGDNLTQIETEQFSDYLSAFGEQAENQHALVKGNVNADNVVYMVVDANCGYCKKAYKELDSFVSSNSGANLKTVYIPVGYLGQDSIKKSQLLLGETDKTKALSMLDNFMHNQSFESDSSVAAQGAVYNNDNTNWAQKSGFTGVPVVVSLVNGKWKMHNGAPDSSFYQMLSEETVTAKVE